MRLYLQWLKKLMKIYFRVFIVFMIVAIIWLLSYKPNTSDPYGPSQGRSDIDVTECSPNCYFG